MNYAKSIKFLIASFVVFLIIVLSFGYFQYTEDKKQIYKNIDEKLFASATNLNLLLGEKFFETANVKNSIPESDDLQNIIKLSKFAHNSGVVYVYSLILKDGNIHFTSSSATQNELKTGRNLTRYFDVYDDASIELKESFKTKSVRFAEYSDKWGTFRSVFIPKISSSGKLYVVAADIKLEEIDKKLQKSTIWLGVKVVFILLVGILLLFWQLAIKNKNLSSENKALTEEQTRLNCLIDNLKISKKKIREQNLLDELTQIPNRKAYNNKIQESLNLLKRYNQPFSIALFDIDNFKKINDTYGHFSGDIVLQQISRYISDSIRATDYVFRVGGEEFVIILANTKIDDAFELIQRIRFGVSQMNFLENEKITISVGVIEACIKDNADELYQKADGLMYKAKQNGKNKVFR